MKRLFPLACAALLLAAVPCASARKTPRPQQNPQPQTGSLPPVSSAAYRLSREKGWVEGRVEPDSGAAKLVTLFVPDLTQPGGSRSVSEYLDEEGNFRFAVDLYGPATLGMKYDGAYAELFLYPDDTLRMGFRSSDFREGNDGSMASLTFGENRSGVASRHRMGFARLKKATPVPEFAPVTDMASWIGFLRGRDSADRATLARYVAAANPPAEIADMMGRAIDNMYLGYTWQGYVTGTGPVRPEQVRELHRSVGFPVTDDGNFVDCNYVYGLYQTGMSYMFSDTSSVRMEREKMACALDSILVEYPASLSRDVMCLQLFCGVAAWNRTPELYARIYPLRGCYIASPLVRDLVPAPPASAEQAVAGAAETGTRPGGRNFYNLPLREAERFIGELFAPYRGMGKVLYVDVWGVGCAPCRAEMPHSVKLHAELAGLPVEFLYICVDSKERDWEKLKRELKIEQTGRHVLLSADEGDILRRYMGFSGIPMYWIIDKKGRLRGGSRPGDGVTKDLLLKLAGE